MSKSSIVGIVVAVVLLTLFTSLLLMHRIGEATYGALILLTLLASVIAPTLPRLQELNLKELKLTLQEIKEVKADIEQMYGGIDHLRREPYVMDDAKMQTLGLRPKSLVVGDGAARYTSGVVKRERERLARVFINEKSPEKLAAAILDASLDDQVFKWNGPETPLDAPPQSVAQREKIKQGNNE